MTDNTLDAKSTPYCPYFRGEFPGRSYSDFVRKSTLIALKDLRFNRSSPGSLLATGPPSVGSADGGMRAYAAQTGDIIWTFDTNRAFDTVNGIAANGGSMDGPGPVVAGGMLFVTSGNGGIVVTPTTNCRTGRCRKMKNA